MGAWLLLLFAFYLGSEVTMGGPRAAGADPLPLFWLLPTTWVAVHYGRQLLRHRPSAPLSLSREEMASVRWEFVPSPAESAYMETLQRLARAAPVLGGTTARELLPHLNGLLENARELDRQRARLRSTFGKETAAELEAKCAELARRIDASSDPLVCQALHQSRDLCAERQRGRLGLDAGLARVEAQLEWVDQTFASVEATLARVHITPGSVTQPDLAAISHSLAQITRQTRAVEDALREITET